jgi:hypothetical protein
MKVWYTVQGESNALQLELVKLQLTVLHANIQYTY